MINISIIMPLYNASRYLKEALKSVLRQTYQDFELICVNDASTDNTLEILQEFQDEDKRIIVMSNETRMGAGDSRNRGLKIAKGRYITFLDGDDIFEEEMLQLAYQEMEKHHADIVIYEYKLVPSEHIYEKDIVERSMEFIERYCQKPFTVREYDAMEFLSWNTAPWNKLYRKGFILAHQLEFQSLSCSNDTYFVLMALILAEKIIMLPDRRIMVYSREHNEITRISYDRDPMCAYMSIEKLGKELYIRNKLSEMYQHYYLFVCRELRRALYTTKKKENAERFYDFLRSEGVDNLISIAPEYYIKVEDGIKLLLKNFKQMDFCSEWYKDYNSFKAQLYKNEKRFVDLFQFYMDRNQKIILWGAGKRGKLFLDFLEHKQLRVSEVVDRDETKQGSLICGYIIGDPEGISGQMLAILVTSASIYKDALSAATGKDNEVINIEELLKGIQDNNEDSKIITEYLRKIW